MYGYRSHPRLTIAATAAVCAAAVLIVRRRLRSQPQPLLIMRDGARLPYEVSGPEEGPLRIVVAHGLGSKDPASKTHADDATRPVVMPVLRGIGCRAVFYTARGHGASTGWEGSGEEQFQWSRLAHDLLEVADAHGLRDFVAVGNSMGAATALSAALQDPERVAALVLYRPPTLWDARSARRATLLAQADSVRPPHRAVVRGAAATNLPPADDPAWEALRAAAIPTLLLVHGEDAVHPIASGEALLELLPHATLKRAENAADAEARFPRALAEWMWSLINDEDRVGSDGRAL